MPDPAWLHTLLANRATDELASRFDGEPHVDHPQTGEVIGTEALTRFVRATANWLEGHRAEIEPVAIVEDGRRSVAEVLLHVDTNEGRWGLPVAVVADLSSGALTYVRVYHSLWPLTGAHRVRGPILPPDPSIALDGSVGDYQKALAAGDVDGILATYEPDGTTREPSGGPFVSCGTESIREIYTLLFANGGGIPLQFCTATDDGNVCAIEYNVDRWGRTSIPPQCGVAVYVRAASGRLAAARIYDDVEPPAVSQSRKR